MPSAADCPVDLLYQTHRYPAMSHPLSDPAVTAVAARLGGLTTAEPRHARILEIGCASGHNLLPLARRWPQSQWVGIDLAVPAIAEARQLAAEAGIANVEFHAVDLRYFDPGDRPFDYIIAHGVFSWVPDEVKFALLDFCRRHLAPAGVATISFNLATGWAHRLPVIAMLRSLQAATGGELIATLELLRATLDPATPHGAHLQWILDNMLAKGADLLLFDDFAPVNDPWPFEQFVQVAAGAGLRWLGECDPAENLPSTLGEAARAALSPLAAHPLHAQLAADFAAGRTFRSGVLCRDDAGTLPGLTRDGVFDLAVRAAEGVAPSSDPLALAFSQALAATAPSCVPLRDILAAMPGVDRPALARLVFDGITRGWLLPRIEALCFDPLPPPRPCLNSLRLACARRGLALADAWHQPCRFPPAHYEVLVAMDGSRSQAELATISLARCPDLAFEPWLLYLAARGLFEADVQV
ncbi:MAG: methyltransferase domain-containing protein [Verrucomicrobia bacterium]|nr:MAG: methyltransferase domain-containing protein [Verrucomicrobiota bacterium]